MYPTSDLVFTFDFSSTSSNIIDHSPRMFCRQVTPSPSCTNVLGYRRDLVNIPLLSRRVTSTILVICFVTTPIKPPASTASLFRMITRVPSAIKRGDERFVHRGNFSTHCRTRFSRVTIGKITCFNRPYRRGEEALSWEYSNSGSPHSVQHAKAGPQPPQFGQRRAPLQVLSLESLALNNIKAFSQIVCSHDLERQFHPLWRAGFAR